MLRQRSSHSESGQCCFPRICRPYKSFPSRYRCPAEDRFLCSRHETTCIPFSRARGGRVRVLLWSFSRTFSHNFQLLCRHDEYRPSLLEHLITVTIRHWDPAMRQLGAKAIREICQLDRHNLTPRCVERVVSRSLLLQVM